MPTYSKRPESMCEGEGCSNPSCYAHGGKVKGVHEETYSSRASNKGESYAGHLVRESKDAEAMNNNNENESAVTDPLDKAKHEHRHVLKELKEMKKPHGNYAEGGEVKGVHPSAGKFARAHKGEYSQEGQSMAGSASRGGHNEWAKDQHRRVLGEMKSNPKPHGEFAHGGEVKEAMDMGGDEDHQLRGAMGGELMDALHRKDKKGIMDSIEAIVLSMKDRE